MIDKEICDKVLNQIKDYIESTDNIDKFSFSIDGTIITVKRNNKKYCRIDMGNFTEECIIKSTPDWEKYLFAKLDCTGSSSSYSDYSSDRFNKPLYKKEEHSFSDLCPKPSRKESCSEPAYIRGPTGPAGPRGYPGSQGAQGPRGKPGKCECPRNNCYPKNKCYPDDCSCGDCDKKNGGKTGPTGPKGDQGIQGAPGIEGLVGPRGATGVTGVAGSTGATGATGPTGLGATGLKGDTGIRGKRGPTGCPGIPGERGKRGPTGCQGERGCDGRRGCDGADGCQGPQGPTGCRGLCGLPGATGPIGVTGHTGPTGIIGPTGVTGAVGPQGLIGPIGNQGIRGPLGPTGPALPLNIINADSIIQIPITDLQLQRTLHYNPELRVSAMDSESVSNPLNNVTTFHDKAVIASSNISMQNVNNHNTVVLASNDGTISNNSSLNFVGGCNNFIIDGSSFNNAIIGSKGVRTSNSSSTAFVGTINGSVNNGAILGNVIGGAIIGCDRNINMVRSVAATSNVTGCSIMSSTNSSLKTGSTGIAETTLISCGTDTGPILIEGAVTTLGAALNDVTMANIVNSGIMASTNIKANNMVDNNMILGCSNNNVSDWTNIHQSMLVASNLNSLSSIAPRSSNTIVGANSTGLKWEINSENGNIVNEGTISSSTPISGFAKMMENLDSTHIISPGRLLRIAAKNKVRLCVDNEIPQLVSRAFNACTFITNNADFKWHKTMMRDEWGSIIYETVIDQSFEKLKLANTNASFEVSNILTALGNNRNIIVNKITIINNKPNKTNTDLTNLAILQADLSELDNEIKYNQAKFMKISNWLTINQFIVKQISVPKINPNYDPSLAYIPRNKRPLEWTACEWSGMAPVLVDLTVLEENYVMSGPNGIGKFSASATRIYCVEILDSSTNVEISNETNILLMSGLYKLALCAIGL